MLFEIIAATMLMASAASAEPTSQAAGQAEPAAEGEMTVTHIKQRDESIPDDRTIKCKSIKEVGSRIPTRVCRTMTEWSQIEAEMKQNAQDNMRNKGASGNGPGD